jgi:cytidine deaminase
MLTKESGQDLVQAARRVRKLAYAPYSHYTVAAAVLTNTGKVFTGVNIENASYPAGICAERVAIFKAISEGERDFTAIAVITDNGGAPCGVCRQVLAEFGMDITVIIADGQGKIVHETTIKDLLPHAFTPKDLI